jgi:hypothetical protein
LVIPIAAMSVAAMPAFAAPRYHRQLRRPDLGRIVLTQPGCG